MKRSVAQASLLEPDHNGAPRTIAESIYHRLRQDILWGRFIPGSPLRSDDLRERYDVGISPLREALTRLASERLVTTVGQRGFRVAPLTAYDVEDTMATRLVIEGEALARSMERGDIAWETSVVAAFHALSRHPIPKGPVHQRRSGRSITASFTWRCCRPAARAGTWTLPAFCLTKRNGTGCCGQNLDRKKYLSGTRCESTSKSSRRRSRAMSRLRSALSENIIRRRPNKSSRCSPGSRESSPSAAEATPRFGAA